MAASAWRHRRGAELIKLLALAPAHRLHREQVMDALWPDLSPDAAATNLRKAIHYLRRALGTAVPVVIQSEFVALCPDGLVLTDVERFEAAAKEALGAGPRACDRAAALYGGELVPEDRYASWAFEPRERLRLRYVQLLKLAGNWERVLEVDPADEEGHRALMQAQFDAGNRQGVLRQFARMRDALGSDLGIGPGRASVQLYEKALAMEAAVPATSAEQVNAQLAWGLVHWNRMELDDAQHCAENARALAIDAALGRELGEATAILGMVAQAQGRWHELFQAEFEETLNDRPAAAPYFFDAQICLAEFWLYGPKSHNQIEPFARALLDIAARAGSPQGQGVAWLMLGEAALFAGDLEDATARLQRAAKLQRTPTAASALALTLIRAAETEIARGRSRLASRLLDQAMSLAPTTPLAAHLMVRCFAARILAATGPERAAAALDNAERSLADSSACQPCSIGYQVAAAITRARNGDVIRSERHLEQAERIAGMWQGGPWQAAVWEARGHLRIAEGDQRQGVALLNEAATMFSQVGRPLDALRCRVEAA